MNTLKNVKTRSEHYCSTCGDIIPAGTWCKYWERREPKYKNDVQVGIDYVKAWFHNPPLEDELDCWEIVDQRESAQNTQKE